MNCFDSDWRNIKNGFLIPSEGYADQPYLIKTKKGDLLLVMTTAKGHEGASSQHIVSYRSTDSGKTWSHKTDIEASSGIESSYAVLHETKTGRIFVFYNYNLHNVRSIKTEDGGIFNRVDSLGEYVFRYSDDGGITWSKDRYVINIRNFDCDDQNIYSGKIRFFWNVGKPLRLNSGKVLIPHHKVGAMGEGFYAQSEGAFLRSSNLETELDPSKITFETLPLGKKGITAPEGGGRIAEEQSIVELSDGTIYCVYRTIDGYPCYSTSSDEGETWKPSSYITRSNGKPLKHPRAANFVWKYQEGKYLYWYHNHGGEFIKRLANNGSETNGLSKNGGRTPYDDRNPVWVCSGVEMSDNESRYIEWSQPEVLFYDDDPFIRISYPDLVIFDGWVGFAETQKTIARFHQVKRTFINELFDKSLVNFRDIWSEDNSHQEKVLMRVPLLPVFTKRNSHNMSQDTLDCRTYLLISLTLKLDSNTPRVLFDSTDTEGSGIKIEFLTDGSLRLTLSDGRTASSWNSDKGSMKLGESINLKIHLDGGPKIIHFEFNSIKDDGGNERQFGWGRFSPNLSHVNGSPEAKIDRSVLCISFQEKLT